MFWLSVRVTVMAAATVVGNVLFGAFALVGQMVPEIRLVSFLLWIGFNWFLAKCFKKEWLDSRAEIVKLSRLLGFTLLCVVPPALSCSIIRVSPKIDPICSSLLLLATAVSMLCTIDQLRKVCRERAV